MYKTPCYFRTRIGVCTFKAEDCGPDNCDLYDLKWEYKALFKRLKQLRRDTKALESSLKGLKKADKRAYKDTKELINDNFAGAVYITKAIYSVKRSKK